MLYSVQDTQQQSLLESVLENSTFLHESIKTFSKDSIPVVSIDESTYIVDSVYVDRLADEEEITLNEALENICLTNTIPNEYLYVAFQEHEIILNPSIVNEVSNYVIIPISENSLAYTFCESCIDAFIESGDEVWLECLLNEDYLDDIHDIMNDKGIPQDEKYKAVARIRTKANPQEVEASRREHQANPSGRFGTHSGGYTNTRYGTVDTLLRKGKRIAGNIGDRVKQMGSDAVNYAKNNKGKVALATAGVVGAGIAAKKFYDHKQDQKAQMEYYRRIEQEAANKPKGWIAKKIASLRSIYQNYLQRAREAKESGQASIFQKIASVILGVIDKLMAKLQSITDRR